MVDRTLTTAAFCLCSAILAVLLRRYCTEQSMLIAIAACIGVTAAALAVLSPMLSELTEIFTEAGISDGYAALVFKATAICLITQLTSSLCKDCGESAIASAAEIWGRGAVAYISLPLIRAIVDEIRGML